MDGNGVCWIFESRYNYSQLEEEEAKRLMKIRERPVAKRHVLRAIEDVDGRDFYKCDRCNGVFYF